MDFVQKNNTVIRLTDADMFDIDKKIFDEKRPNSKLHKRLRGANQFNKKDLDGDMLFELLDHITEKEILDNRKACTDEQKKSKGKPKKKKAGDGSKGSRTRSNPTTVKSLTRQQKKSAQKRSSSLRSPGKKQTKN